MGKVMDNPVDLNLFERTATGTLLLEFVDKKRDVVRFEADINGIKTIVNKLQNWVDEKEREDERREDKIAS